MTVVSESMEAVVRQTLPTNGHSKSQERKETPARSQDVFENRHIGPSDQEIRSMLQALGVSSLDEFIEQVVPASIRSPEGSGFQAAALSEQETLALLKQKASKNKVFRSYIGLGYYGCITPPVIQRNILENPGWYTQYTPYQAEIAQGRLEALLNYQTLVSDLTALPVSNASLLDEGTAAAEALGICWAKGEDRSNFLIADNCHPQTIEVARTRGKALGINVEVVCLDQMQCNNQVCGILLQYPATNGSIESLSVYKNIAAKAHEAGALVAVATDLLALTLLTPPGEWGADIALGSAQRFGVPMGFGGPHAAFFAVKDELKRLMPGRLVGVSKDSAGRPGLRLSLQTREQHIRREKATSNICTAQVLLAVMASMYAVFHGPKGVRRIAERIHGFTGTLSEHLKRAGLKLKSEFFFDTLTVDVSGDVRQEILKRAKKFKVNLRQDLSSELGVSLDESTTAPEIGTLIEIFTGEKVGSADETAIGHHFPNEHGFPKELSRTSPYLTHPVFNTHHSETEFLRYLKRLESRDLSLAVSMIPLGSCTMKLNATSEMLPVTWAEFGTIHPFAPEDQTKGYREMFKDLEEALKKITGFAAVSLQPNSGAQGEFAGLLVIRAYHESKGEGHRDVCLIPRSAHGTNPASAAMAGLKVVAVECDSNGNIDMSDLFRKAEEHKDALSCLMVTYPSTHGVFEESIKDVSKIVHRFGGQVYMDGANLNALVGLCRPYDIGADVCHINLHKTFCIPHGGGGPGMGPIGVRKHLAAFLPNHPLVDLKHENGVGPISAAPWGSAGILPIPWVYIVAMGGIGLKRATQVSILSANYIAKRLEQHYPILYKGRNGFVAHECILDCREFKRSCGIEVVDIAKRLMDYGFHAPTVSWPVAETLMVEPTESEAQDELDRFCDALIQIREEIRSVENGKSDPLNNPLKNAPHTALVVTSDSWDRPYGREQAAFPVPRLRDYKFWPAVGRIDSAYGDKNLICSCPPLDSY